MTITEPIQVELITDPKKRKELRDKLSAEYKRLTGEQLNLIEIEGRKKSIGKYKPSAKKHIVDISCKYLKLDKQDVLGPSRKASLVKCRHMIGYLLHTTGVTLTEIADITGRKDHSTVEHGIKTVKGYLKVDKEYKEEYKQYKEHCLRELDKRAKVNQPPLTKEQKEAIIYSLEKGNTTQTELAEIYGVTPQTISKYVIQNKKNKKK